VDDKTDFSWLESDWEAGRAVHISEELLADYNRFMTELAPSQVQIKLDTMDATGASTDPAGRAQVAWMQVSAQGVLAAVALYLARHGGDPAGSVP
jgi:hypothetical protein